MDTGDPPPIDDGQRRRGFPAPAVVTGRVLAYIDADPRAAGAHQPPRVPVTVALAVAAVVGLTAGQTFAPLDALNVFGPRKKGVGQQGVPVNRTSAQAKVATTALAADWVLTLAVGGTERSVQPCRTGRAPADRCGPAHRLRGGVEPDGLLAGGAPARPRRPAGGSPDADLRLISLEQRGGFKQTEMGSEYVRDPLTLVALELNGETLDLEHGYPARMIAPGRPGVLQTKWLSRIEAIDA